MPYKIGLVGLPNVGKSSLFSFLTRKDWDKIKNYPFATIEPNVGMMPLLDSRLEKLGQFWQSPLVPSFVEIVDIAGLVKGASEGLGLGNEFLSHIREVDLICHVLRCFPEKEIIHVEKSVNPLRDFEIIQLELILADLQQVTRKLERFKFRDEKSRQEQKILQLLQVNLEKGISINKINLSDEEKEIVKNYHFLTAKPFFLLLNYGDKEEEIKKMVHYIQEKQLIYFPLALKLEEEVRKLSSLEKKELGIFPANLSLLAEKIKQLLKLKTFFTAGEKEVKSWLTKNETSAKGCAGLIHSDFEKKIAQVEVYNYEDWKIIQDKNQLLNSGKIRKESIRYIVKDGDICYFMVRKS
ncbi:MAG: GTP-dependent nucleic acid-binding protein EngD [Mycoplasmataceae bacterium RC_NB112A]|nr:MAG: GTP-dependent nucleic acid-binding protein EngD [Mycoplasmataceae bacterium RC_NB112A]KLL01899.1 MAG: GTP-dependent nucleic acid-binding protein EngD [Mycoplasmataceae bacterium RC_NB112A]